MAVLPFENLSPDPNSCLLCSAGIHESIAQSVSQDSSILSVIARTSVMQYEDDRSTDSTDIAEELRVETGHGGKRQV